MDADVLLMGGTVVDGTGAEPFPADVAVTSGVITAVASPGSFTGNQCGTVLDAKGRAVAPGFIDAHTHSDLAMLLPDEWRDITLAPLRQGVTTEVCGNCGESPFPRTSQYSAQTDAFANSLFQLGLGSFDSLASYADHLSDAALPTNQAPLLGHGMLRGAAMGFADRAPDADELLLMERLAEEAFEQGAFGLSTGLMYTPGQFAAVPEIARIAAVAARWGAPYVSHMRDETDGVDESIREALLVGELSGAAVHISHHKIAGRSNWGRSGQTLAMLSAARDVGRDVTLDVYPYTAASTALHCLLPPWTNAGGLAAMLGRVADHGLRPAIARDLAGGLPRWQNLAAAAGWDSIVIAGSPSCRSMEGQSIAEISSGTGQSPTDVMCDLVYADEAQTIVVLHMMDVADVQAIREWEGAMVGSDGVPLPGKPHPRIAGSFAKALRAPADADPWAGIAARVHRMTGMPAQRYRIAARGVLEVGAAADVVVFDPVAIADGSTYAEPLLPPTGVDHVLVNGVHSIAGGRPTGRCGGEVLRAR